MRTHRPCPARVSFAPIVMARGTIARLDGQPAGELVSMRALARAREAGESIPHGGETPGPAHPDLGSQARAPRPVPGGYARPRLPRGGGLEAHSGICRFASFQLVALLVTLVGTAPAFRRVAPRLGATSNSSDVPAELGVTANPSATPTTPVV